MASDQPTQPSTETADGLRRERDALARRAAELEAAVRDLEAFNHAIAHDLRAPLRAIDGFAQALDERIGASLGEEDRRLLGRVRRGARRMGRLIDDLLAFGQLSRRELVRGSVDMGVLAKLAFEEVKRAQDRPDARLELGELPPAHGDATMLRQALLILLSNAVKFSSKRPEIVVEVGGRVDGGECVYFVKDRGEGFDMKYAGKLFKVFQRLHGPEEFEGSGVGLAAVARVASRHGGRVWAEGRHGEGATFSLALPRSP